MKKTILALILFATALTQATAQVEPYHMNEPRLGRIIYALPRTDIIVRATAQCTVQKPGPLAQYAQRFLADMSAITQASASWQLTGLKILTKAEPDTARMYAIDAESLIINYNAAGLVSSIGIEREPEKPEHHRHAAKDTAITFTYKYLGEEALTSTSIPKMAERVAKQIMQIREARQALLTGDAPHTIDGQALSTMLSEMDHQEAELTALFLGKRVTYTVSREYRVSPAGDLQNMIVARISQLEGLKEPDDMLGTPIYLNLKCRPTAQPAQQKRDKQRHGYYYNVPGRAEVSVTDNHGHTATAVLTIPQLGYATYLNPAYTKVIFNPETGEITTIR